MTTKPSKDFTQIKQAGLKAVELYDAHQAILAPRLPAGTADGLKTNLGALGVAVPGAQTVRAAAHVATQQQNGAARTAHGIISAVRRNVARRSAPADVRKAYGVGDKRSLRSVKNVCDAASRILQRAQEQPDEAAALGILDKDIQALTEARDALTTADNRQEQLRAAAPTATRERNGVARQIVAAIDAIAGAGIVEFASDPETRARFEALLGAGRRRRVAQPPAPPPAPPTA